MDKVIKIVKDGPYIVRGGIPLYEKVISMEDGLHVWKDGRELPQAEVYSLCRCGRSENAPFCDGSHTRFKGDETADRRPFAERAKVHQGETIDIMDDERCSKSRFCHRREATIWKMLPRTDDPDTRNEVIRGACECPSGRTIAVDKDGNIHEDVLEPSIYIIQDPASNVSGGIYAMGGIPLESSDGERYETMNRMVLCRCGHSRNKPFCDAVHIPKRYKDTRKGISLFRK